MQTVEGTSRTWLGPLASLVFAVIGVTGVLMFFHVRFPGMAILHELGGMLFVVVAVWHLKLNWKTLCRYCCHRKGLAGLLVGALLMTLFAGLGLGHDNRHRERHGGPTCQEARTR